MKKIKTTAFIKYEGPVGSPLLLEWDSLTASHKTRYGQGHAFHTVLGNMVEIFSNCFSEGMLKGPEMLFFTSA